MRAGNLHLSSGQLTAITAAAQAIDPAWRERFLQSVADELLPLNQISDLEVNNAIHRAVSRMSGVAA